MSDAADKAAEARNRLSGNSFELNTMMLEPVKRLSEELAHAIRSRNSWTATVAPFPNAMRVSCYWVPSYPFQDNVMGTSPYRTCMTEGGMHDAQDALP